MEINSFRWSDSDGIPCVSARYVATRDPVANQGGGGGSEGGVPVGPRPPRVPPTQTVPKDGSATAVNLHGNGTQKCHRRPVRLSIVNVQFLSPALNLFKPQ